MPGRLIVIEKQRSSFAFALHAIFEFIERADTVTRFIIGASKVEPGQPRVSQRNVCRSTSGSNGVSGLGEDSGNSDFRYSSSNNAWQFSWQTPDSAGYFKIAVSPPGANVESAWECINLR